MAGPDDGVMAAPAFTIVPPVKSESRLDVEIVVPVYNEEQALRPSIERLHEFLSTNEFPLTWQIVIADNASSDDSLEVAQQLSALSGLAIGTRLGGPPIGKRFGFPCATSAVCNADDQLC